MKRGHVDPLGALYAQVLGEAAWAKGGEPLLREVGEALSALGQAWATERSMRAYFLSGMVKAEKKKKALAKMIEGLPPLLQDFVHLLLRRGRGRVIDKVALAYEDYMDEKLGRIPVTLTSATPLPDEQVQAWVDRIQAATGKEPVVEFVVKPELIAGAILQVGDSIVDGSTRRRVNEFLVSFRERGKHALQA